MSEIGKYKRTVEARTVLNIGPDKAWKLIENVQGYPKFVKFMRSSKIEGGFTEGNYWTDISTVMFLSLKITHEIIVVKKGRKAVFLIKLPIKGKILQTIILTPLKKGVEMKVIVDIDWESKIMDLILGKTLENRTKQMLEGTVDNSRNSY